VGGLPREGLAAAAVSKCMMSRSPAAPCPGASPCSVHWSAMHASQVYAHVCVFGTQAELDAVRIVLLLRGLGLSATCSFQLRWSPAAMMHATRSPHEGSQLQQRVEHK
jgi:hypothetical protein